MQNLRIGTTEYTVEGPTPHYGTYLLTGPRGAEYITTPAYTNDSGVLKVISISRSGVVRELRNGSNAVRLVVRNGELADFTGETWR